MIDSWPWLVLGFVVWIFAGGRYIIALAPFIAPVFFLHAIDVDGWQGVAGVWLALFVSTSISYRGVIPVPRQAYAVIVAAIAVTAVLPFVAYAAVAPRMPGFAATLVFPLAFTTLEFLSARVHPYRSWGSLAYTQYGILPLMQLASVTGIFGITFMVCWSSAVANWIWLKPDAVADNTLGLGIFAAIWTLILLFGGARLLRPVGETMRTAGIGWPEGIITREEIFLCLLGKVAESLIEGLREKFARVNEELFSASRTEADAGAKIIVWPEACAPTFKEDEGALLDRCRRFAAEKKVYLLVGLATIERNSEKAFRNHAVLIASDGEISFDYTKRIPVPGFEATVSVRGSPHLSVAKTPYGTIATAICYDIDTPHFIRQAGKARADLLLVPASDWREIGHIHFVFAVYRAIENGASLLRPVRWADSVATDPYGRVLALMDHFATQDRRMPALLPKHGVRTVYSTIGDTFAWACVAGFIAISAWAVTG